MKRAKKLLLMALMLFTLPAGSCPGDSPTGSIVDEFERPNDPVPEEADTANLAGRVLINGEGAGGIAVTLTSKSLSSPKTNSTRKSGVYFFRELAAGPHAVSISGVPSDVRFETLSQEVDIVVGSDFEGDPIVNRGPTFEGFRDVTVDVLIFLDNAYPTARFVEAGPESGGCDAAHWHSHDRVPLLASRSDSGPAFDCVAPKNFHKSDPAPRQCGHGKVQEVLRQDILLPWECLDAYIEEWGPLAP